MGAGRHAPIAGEDQAYVIAALLENPEPHHRKICPLVGPVEMNRTTSQRPSAAPSAASIRMSCMRVRLRIWSRSSSGAESIVITQQLQRVAAFPYRLCSRDAEHAKGFHSTVFGLRDDGAALVAWRIRC